jgi:hypothetical protein
MIWPKGGRASRSSPPAASRGGGPFALDTSWLAPMPPCSCGAKGQPGEVGPSRRLRPVAVFCPGKRSLGSTSSSNRPRNAPPARAVSLGSLWAWRPNPARRARSARSDGVIMEPTPPSWPERPPCHPRSAMVRHRSIESSARTCLIRRTARWADHLPRLLASVLPSEPKLKKSPGHLGLCGPQPERGHRPSPRPRSLLIPPQWSWSKPWS